MPAAFPRHKMLVRMFSLGLWLFQGNSRQQGTGYSPWLYKLVLSTTGAKGSRITQNWKIQRQFHNDTAWTADGYAVGFVWLYYKSKADVYLWTKCHQQKSGHGSGSNPSPFAPLLYSQEHFVDVVKNPVLLTLKGRLKSITEFLGSVQQCELVYYKISFSTNHITH